MIKLFRNIRQKLLNEGRTAKYLTYAIGEIALVMIGILLALQVNNWNELRKDRLREVKFLKGLKADFEVDLRNMEFFIIDKESKAYSASILLQSADPVSPSDIHTLDSLSWKVCVWNTFVPSTKTLDELTSSGNLSLISNDSLKSRTLDLAQEYQDLAVHTEHMRREYDYYLYDRSAELKELVPFLNWERFLKSNEFSYQVEASEERLNELRGQWVTVLDDMAFQNGLKLAMLNNTIMYESCTSMSEQIKVLLKMLEKEIQKAP